MFKFVGEKFILDEVYYKYEYSAHYWRIGGRVKVRQLRDLL
jgi:hypothetical protein